MSGIVALTLSPVSCALILKAPDAGRQTIEDRNVQFVDARTDALKERHHRPLDASLLSELAPNEDQGIILTQSTSAPNATLQQKLVYADQVYKILAKHPETRAVFQINSPTTNIGGWVMTPADERKEGAESLRRTIQGELGVVAGLCIVAFQQPPLPGATGLLIQFVVQTIEPFDKLDLVSRELMSEALKTGQFMFLDTDLKIDQPQSSLVIDREKTAQLGLTMNDVGGALTAVLSGGFTHYFGLGGRSYKVIPQIAQRFRLNADQTLDYYIKTADGASVGTLFTLFVLPTVYLVLAADHSVKAMRARPNIRRRPRMLRDGQLWRLWSRMLSRSPCGGALPSRRETGILVRSRKELMGDEARWRRDDSAIQKDNLYIHKSKASQKSYKECALIASSQTI